MLLAEGVSNAAVAERVGVTRQTVGGWRFRERGLEGADESRPRAARRIDDDKVES